MITTEDDLCLAFDVCDDELECDFVCDIERVQPDAYLNDDAASLQSVRDWLDRIVTMAMPEKVDVILAMMKLPTCRQHIAYEIMALNRARELDDLDPTDAQLCAAGY